METESTKRILIAEDEPSMREVLEMLLGRAGYVVRGVADGVEALEAQRENPADIVIADLKMPRLDGLGLLVELKRQMPDITVIVITAFSTWKTAVEAMRLGAYDYIKKPFDNELIRATVERASRRMEMLRRSALTAGGAGEALDTIIGSSAPMRQVQEIIRRVAPTDSTVLITGESGTGKELVARAVHRYSLRSENPFIVCNCAAFNEPLMESEIFGHVKGAFTGATADKLGLIEVANLGTFFLDEVGQLTPTIQAKLLRVLEEREFKAVGSNEVKHADVRFIGATSTNLPEEVERGNFREDLYYRLNVIPIQLPPLRERIDDMPLLVGHFLAKHSGDSDRDAAPGFTQDAVGALANYSWPGNVRELENVVRRALTLCDAGTVDMDAVAGSLRERGAAPPSDKIPVVSEEGISLDEKLRELESAYIAGALENTGGNVTKAAELLGMSFRSLRYRIRRLGLHLPKSKTEGKEQKTED